ncbi:MAG TPA: HPP family protein [Dehalococcoidia bacterium]|nr:HPP family protein [Dehalococcoidia bacterium]
MELIANYRKKLLHFFESFVISRSYLSSVTAGFRISRKYYICQSLVATVVVLIVFLILTENHAVVVASLGSTAFIIFAMPRSITAEPRRVIGGHLMGIISGSLFAFIPQLSLIPSAIIYSIAVGISIFLMVSTKTEHPPASGTALGIALNGLTVSVALAVVISAALLSVSHYFLKRYLRDLT